MSKKTYTVLFFLAGAQNAANSFNFQTFQTEQDLVDNKEDVYIKI